jgi:hypothetical protein
VLAVQAVEFTLLGLFCRVAFRNVGYRYTVNVKKCKDTYIQSDGLFVGGLRDLN